MRAFLGAYRAWLARMLLEQLDALSAQIGKLTDRTTAPAAGWGKGAPQLPAAGQPGRLPLTRSPAHHC